MSANPKLIAARQLIEEGHIKEARALLKTINDPVAERWLAQLNASRPHQVRKTNWTQYALIATLCGGVVVVFVVVVILFMMPPNSNQQAAFVPTLRPTITALPSSTPLPTFTPTPSVTPTPSSTPEPDCNGIAADWWEEAQPLVENFLDTTETANVTARMSLAPVVLELADVQRDFEDLEYHACLRQVYRYINNGMSQVVEGFNLFLGVYEYSAMDEFDDAERNFRDAHEALEELGVSPDRRMDNIF